MKESGDVDRKTEGEVLAIVNGALVALLVAHLALWCACCAPPTHEPIPSGDHDELLLVGPTDPGGG